jgi:hypothetical protein
MPRQRSARPVGEQCEALIQPLVQFLHRHRPQARGRKLDRQRYAIEAVADRSQRRGILGRDAEMGTQQSRAVDEQAHAFIGKHSVRRDVVARTRHRERRDSVGKLSCDAEPLPARYENDDVRAATQNEIHELHASLEQVLGVVEHEQQLIRGKMVAECLDQGPHRLLLDFKHLGRSLRHETRIRERGEFYEPNTVGKRVDQPARHFDHQARLARTTGTGQRHQPVRFHELLELRDLLFATDEARQVIGQVVLRA